MKRPGYAPPRPGSFWPEARAEAAALLAARGDHRHADAGVLAKAALYFAAMAAAYAAALTAGSATGYAIAYLAFALLGMLLAVNVLHDAAHGTVFRSARANRWLTRLTSLPLGIDSDFWTQRHLHYHHPYANVEGCDLDIEPNFFLRQTPSQRWRPHHRYQHRYWLLIAALSLPYVGWVYDWSDRLGRTPLRHDAVWRQRGGWPLFLGAKAAHFMLMLGLPALLLRPAVLGWGTLAATYLLAQMLASCFVVASLLGTHWVEPAFYALPPGGRFAHDWSEHAFRTAVDWTPRPRRLGYWMGGLNLHLTHHLFPTHSHRHYPALAGIVERVARRHGLPYRRMGYRALWQAQQAFLARLGTRPE